MAKNAESDDLLSRVRDELKLILEEKWVKLDNGFIVY